ncbi:hypothetical protein [Kiritimatiella glycovorans]|uniref:Cell division protein FtsL n=1 Tax=Kiritimatiella glycovorans TaxID=1307763 RepID=A0A0G3EHV2_9BACT|nr:hypothetical protein [Kiritimatiella glycovorans]AKJ65002.1 hypothetical protein L21SP4_01764 [Kiritimatiella glycovorans]
MKKKRRNRRRSSRRRSGPVWVVSLALFLVAGAALGFVYLWLNLRCDSLGSRITRMETRYETLAKELSNEQDRWANLITPANFQRILHSHDLRMVRPRADRVVRVIHPFDGDQRVVSLARSDAGSGRRMQYE